MRRFALFTLTLMLLVGGFVHAQDDTLDVDVQLFVEQNSLTVYIPSPSNAPL